MPVDDVAKLDADWVIDQLGIDISPTRRKCALLGLKVMRGATTGDAVAGPSSRYAASDAVAGFACAQSTISFEPWITSSVVGHEHRHPVLAGQLAHRACASG